MTCSWNLFDMEHRLFETPRDCDPGFYSVRPESDHINEPAQALRIHIAASLAAWLLRFRHKTLVDLGCGNGGLIRTVKALVPSAKCWGYDLTPSNIASAIGSGIDARLSDITSDEIEWGEVVVLSEVLEHLPDPRGMLGRCPSGVGIIATVPANETTERHYEHHLWCWDLEGFVSMFRRCGFRVPYRFRVGPTIFLMGSKR